MKKTLPHLWRERCILVVKSNEMHGVETGGNRHYFFENIDKLPGIEVKLQIF